MPTVQISTAASSPPLARAWTRMISGKRSVFSVLTHHEDGRRLNGAATCRSVAAPPLTVPTPTTPMRRTEAALPKRRALPTANARERGRSSAKNGPVPSPHQPIKVSRREERRLAVRLPRGHTAHLRKFSQQFATISWGFDVHMRALPGPALQVADSQTLQISSLGRPQVDRNVLLPSGCRALELGTQGGVVIGIVIRVQVVSAAIRPGVLFRGWTGTGLRWGRRPYRPRRSHGSGYPRAGRRC